MSRADRDKRVTGQPRSGPRDAVARFVRAPVRSLAVAGCCLVLLSCNGQARGVATDDTAIVNCPETRPEMCTQEYRPVCAMRDTGVRCVTTPCDSTAWITYSNGCMACVDPAVIGYRDGACESGAPRPR